MQYYRVTLFFRTATHANPKLCSSTDRVHHLILRAPCLANGDQEFLRLGLAQHLASPKLKFLSRLVDEVIQADLRES